MLQILRNLFKKNTTNKKNHLKSNKTVLIIDDGEVERKYLSRCLEKGGYKVLIAEEGTTGLSLAREHVPNLILLDFIMPGLRGDAVCQQLKLDDRTRQIPVIFLTGSVKPQSIIDSFESGAEYYLAKPITYHELIKHVEMVFRDKEQPAAR